MHLRFWGGAAAGWRAPVCGCSYSENTCWSNGCDMAVNYSGWRAGASVPLTWKWALLECLLLLYLKLKPCVCIVGGCGVPVCVRVLDVHCCTLTSGPIGLCLSYFSSSTSFFFHTFHAVHHNPEQTASPRCSVINFMLHLNTLSHYTDNWLC